MSSPRPTGHSLLIVAEEHVAQSHGVQDEVFETWELPINLPRREAGHSLSCCQGDAVPGCGATVQGPVLTLVMGMLAAASRMLV